MANNKSEVSYSPFSQAWKRLKKNHTAVAGLYYIIFSFVIAILGYLITPDSTPFANDMILEISTKPPGFSTQVLKVKKNKHHESTNLFEKMIWGRPNPYNLVPIVDYHFKDDKIVIDEYVGESGKGYKASYNICNVVYATTLDTTKAEFRNDSIYFKNYKGEQMVKSVNHLRQQIERNHIESKFYLFGTDKYGRDILSRLIIGVRVSLSVGLLVALLSLLIGATLGAIGGYFKGWIDDIIMWLINVIWSIPALLWIIAIAIIQKGFSTIILGLSFVMWVQLARIIRGQVIQLREMEFIEAARALGFNDLRIVGRHILPNILGPVMVVVAANVANSILIEAGLSFLGFGVQPPVPSWGMMIKQNYGYLLTNSPFLAIIPGIAILLLVLAFYLLGNGLRDAFDVRSH